jgi:hypothetical protein
MNYKEKEKLKKIDEQLYQVNASISANFITKIRKPTDKDMMAINGHLANIIKDIRALHEAKEKGYNQIREFLSELEHLQWESWSKNLAQELKRIDSLIDDKADMGDIDKARQIIKDRLARWEKNWIPYSKLDEETKDYDREWADKILDTLPKPCPIHQCGGIMKAVEVSSPSGDPDNHPDGWPGDEQRPNLVCTNCSAVYVFKEFDD